MLGEFGTGPSGDLQAATKLASRMVGSFGMADSLISMDAASFPGAGDLVAKVLSDKASRASVEDMLQTARTRVEAMLIEHQAVVEALRDALLDRDELVAAEITDVIATVSVDPVLDFTDSHSS
jgi:cell division protease FtsH